MELKPLQPAPLPATATLLIVPYGIETMNYTFFKVNPNLLLIVPYGIETVRSAIAREAIYLLIVPYGIET